MNTVVVPVDFSETSISAAKYATNLFKGTYGLELILYHMAADESGADLAQAGLDNLITILQQPGLNITTIITKGRDLIDETDKVARHRKADLIVMGITGRSELAQVLIGSNTLKMAQTKTCPVLIIPPMATYREVKSVLLTTDMKDVVNTIPSALIKNALLAFNYPKLHILNVNSELYISLTEEEQEERNKLKEMFSGFNPEFYFLRLYDVDDAIQQFSEDKQVDMIITIQKEHSLFSRLFNSSHTRKLAYHSNMPVLVVHE
jgi:nucleotide-binding universal stress UspA family protein